MKISTRGRYALRLLLDIAMHQQSGPVAMKDAARRQQISKKYADQISIQLTQTGLLQAERGRAGGYRMIPSPAEVTVLRVVEAVEGPIAPVMCLETEPNTCDRCTFCMTLPVWTGLGQVMREYLAGITLQQVMDQAKPQPD